MALQGRAFDSGLQTTTQVVRFDDHYEIDKLIGLGWAHLGGALWTAPDPSQVAEGTPRSRTFLPRLEGGCIHGDAIVLTHPALDDLDALCANEHDPTTRQHAIFPPADADEMTSRLYEAYPGWRLGDSTFLIARLERSGPPVAKISIRRLVPPGVLDVGYATMPAHRGHGYAAQSLKLFTSWAFGSAGIQRIELGIKPNNIASVCTAVKAGYALESVRRSRLKNADTSFDDEHSYVAVNADRDRGWGHVACAG